MPSFHPEEADWYLDDPHSAFRELRASDPVHWHEAGGFWCVTRHADIQYVSRHPRLFSSARGTQLFEASPSRRGKLLGRAGREAAPAIIRMDPPAHNVHRKLVIGEFTTQRVAKMEPWIRNVARQCLDSIDPADPIDLVDRIAVPLPMQVIAELLVELGGGEMVAANVQAMGEFVAYLGDVIAERRREPQDDLVSHLLASEIEGRRLTDTEMAMFCVTLLVAGNETTRNLISGGALALAQHPDQRDALVTDPSLIPNAVEEMLRWVSPVRSFIRHANQDTELRGRKIQQGEYVALFYASANRDEEVFGDDAEAFDIRRPDARRHIAFGFGEHLCLGAPLARLEARVMFEELLARWPRFEPTAPATPLRSSLMQGIQHLPVTLAP
ncbi:MAG: cytochrome P450 [Deltaproteobacteria bacterium]|nr:cytochrome P450 [Deltaproteobacteria bacterium]